MDASSTSASARAHGGRGVDDTADAATAARWLEGAFMNGRVGTVGTVLDLDFWIMDFSRRRKRRRRRSGGMDGSNAISGRLTIRDCVCVFRVRRRVEDVGEATRVSHEARDGE